MTLAHGALHASELFSSLPKAARPASLEPPSLPRPCATSRAISLLQTSQSEGHRDFSIPPPHRTVLPLRCWCGKAGHPQPSRRLHLGLLTCGRLSPGLEPLESVGNTGSSRLIL